MPKWHHTVLAALAGFASCPLSPTPPSPCPPAMSPSPMAPGESQKRAGCATSRLRHIPCRSRQGGRPGAAPRRWMCACRWAFLPAASEAVAAFREVFCNHLLQRVTAINGTGFEELTVKSSMLANGLSTARRREPEAAARSGR